MQPRAALAYQAHPYSIPFIKEKVENDCNSSPNDKGECSSKLNLPNHRYKRWCCSLILAESDSLPHAHAQTTKTYYKHRLAMFGYVWL
nr:hypothetical protein [Tanacetum cinerariifolium]